MFSTLAGLIAKDSDLPDRAWRLTVLEAVLSGTIYDALMYEFGTEYTGAAEYVPVSSRKPSVRYGLCRTVVEDSVSLLFGEGRFPAIETADPATREALPRIAREARLPEAMTEAAIRGSVGSAMVLVQVLGGRVFFRVLDTAFLTPAWDPLEPDRLLSITELRKVRGDVLRQTGYSVAEGDTASTFWWRRVWDRDAETWYLPQSLEDARAGKAPLFDKARTVRHALGFVPAVWVKNLPGPSATGSEIDGACTFRPAIETSIEIDFQLNQAGRGLKYSSDPTLLIKEPTTAEGEIVRSASNAIVVDKDGDAKLLEIGGTASAAVIEYARALRELAMESIHGNRANADRLSAAQSGRAMELLHPPLIWLADRLRHSYGGGLIELLSLVVQMAGRVPLRFKDGSPVPKLSGEATLRWPAWFSQTEADRSVSAQTLATLVGAGLLSRETAARIAAEQHDTDPDAELLRLKSAPG